MDDKRIREWTSRWVDHIRLSSTLFPTLESAGRELLSEAIAEYKEDAERYRFLCGPELLVSLVYAWEGKVTVPRNAGQGAKAACDEAIDAARRELSARKSESEHE
jgi:hypothetical protein